MKISLDELRTLPQPKLGINFKEVLEGLDAVKPVIGELTVAGGSTGMHLCGRVQTLLKLHCDRCLRPYFQTLNVDIDERFVIQGFELDPQKQTQRVGELLQRDFFEALPADGVLDISDVVYQAVTLATPNVRLCGLECPGPSFADGDEPEAALGDAKEVVVNPKHVDPRWRNLKSLFPKEE